MKTLETVVHSVKKQFKLFLIFAFIFQFLLLPAQENTISVEIHWKENQKITLRNGSPAELLHFENAVARIQTGALPWYSQTLPIAPKFRPTNIRLVIHESEILHNEAGISALDISLAPDDFKWSLVENSNDNGTYFEIQVCPIANNNGKIERLIRASLLYDSIPFTEQGKDMGENFALQSVLASGIWVKLGITESGMYKIGYNDLIAMGLNPTQIDPRRIGIYGNGGASLPEQNSAFRYDDLYENAIAVQGELDGKFDVGDAILFYGEGPASWSFNNLNARFSHVKSIYTDTIYYFLGIGAEGVRKRVETKNQSMLAHNRETYTFLDYMFHENDLENLILSGKDWFGEEFSKSHPERTFNFNFPNRLTERPVNFSTYVGGRSINENIFLSAFSNGQPLFSPIIMAQLGSNNSTYARDAYQAATFLHPSDVIDITIALSAQSNNSKAWLNYITVNAWRQLKFVSGQLQFRNPEGIGANNITRFNISNCNQNLFVWDVTKPLLPANQAFDFSGNAIQFKAKTDSLREYVVFDQNNLKSIASYKRIPNQNLHGIQGCDMLIVAHPQFLTHAQELADIHYQDEGLQSIVVNVQQIYNEFGSGVGDPTAIRDFVRMVYWRSNKQLQYLLLFGDASYDYKDRIQNNTNFVPTYQSSGSLVETQSFVSDDFFGLMDQNEGFEMNGIVDIGIGRLPVKTNAEAANMVHKLRQYLSKQINQTGEWRNNIIFMADDGDGNLHLHQAELLAQQMELSTKSPNIKKIYLDIFKRTAVPGGYRYNDANKALVNALNEGSLIVNYTGHGGINGLTDERVFTIADIEGLKNINKMAFFITATCEFSRFDNPAFVSAGERLLLNADGGSIAIMSTTRLSFAHTNFNINSKVYTAMFNPTDLRIRRLGDIMRLSKNPTNAYVYNFVLLGNPALRLKYPEFNVVVTKFNNRILPAAADTLRAMSEVVFEGRIETLNGSLIENFNGYLLPKMYDKKTTYKTLANDGISLPTQFSYFDKMLYKGRVEVKNGKFIARYKLPRDIAYQFGSGKLSFYALDTITMKDASGFYNNLIVGGTNTTASIDTQGPSISIYANDKGFENGDHVAAESLIFFRIEDNQGVHFLGNSIGRDIMLTHTSETITKYNLNHLFQPELNNFSAGTIVLPMSNLKKGVHKLSLKAWDLHNNSSEKEIWFVVDPDAKIALSKVKNYPNPFSVETQFVFEHNKPNENLDVQIDIYNHMGAWVYSLKKTVFAGNKTIDPIVWKGNDASGRQISPGLYTYRIVVSDRKGSKATTYQRLIFLRN